MDYDNLASLRKHHPAWRLLLADHAPLIIAFVHRSFIGPNVRSLPEQELAAQLDDYLFHLRQGLGEDHFPKPARDYLSTWASDERGWLRRYFPADSDEPHYDLVPAVEQVTQWLAGLEQRTFVAAESRLKLVFDLLRDIAQGSETDPETRITELQRRRAVIDAEIDEIRNGQMAFMDPTRLRERFLQAVETARALLADFRQVEQNFRDLDRQVRERIATWDGGKAAVLEEVLGQRDAITDSDQGRSFRAFWDFLMSADRQQELTSLLEFTLALEPVAELGPDPKLRRIHYDWLTAGEATQRTVARLSEQLRRYLDDQAWLENRRIMDLLRELEQHALAVRDSAPGESFMSVNAPAPDVQLPMDRPLFTPPIKPHIEHNVLKEGDANVAMDPLFEQVYVDKERLRARLRQVLQTRRQISLDELLHDHPLEQGLAELVTWISLATGEGLGMVDESREQIVHWHDSQGKQRRATLPTVIFVNGSQGNRP